jgi:hypothetical protein
MAEKRRGKKILPRVTVDSLRTLDRLIPFRQHEPPTLRAYKLSKAIIQKFVGSDWIDQHIDRARSGYLRFRDDPPQAREQHYMRTIVLAEMLYNLQKIKNFDCCLHELVAGQVEGAYAALEIGRMLATSVTDKGMRFQFVKPSRRRGWSYDLSITFSDGIRVCAETKCKLEETAITLKTITESLKIANKQLPKTRPGFIFVKVPRFWLDDEKFSRGMIDVAEKFLRRTSRVVFSQILHGLYNVFPEHIRRASGRGDCLSRTLKSRSQVQKTQSSKLEHVPRKPVAFTACYNQL